MVVLRRPHLVLADIGNDDVVFGQTAENFVEKTNRRLGQSPWIKLRALGATIDRVR